jgi:adenylate cyclase class IV
MARNAEIKIRIAESRIPEIVAQAIKVGGSDPKILEQEDVYFPLELEVMMRGGQSEAEGCHMVEEVLERIGVKERDVERGSYKELMKLYKTDKDS